jgi:hypothetical protein
MRKKGIESFTIKDIIVNLKPSQVWSIVLILVGIISGSVTLGYKLSSIRLERASITNQELAALKNKERFLTLLHRYNTAYEEWEIAVDNAVITEVGENPGLGLSKKQDARIEANQALLNFIHDLIKKGEVIEDVNNMQGVTLGKGANSSNVTIKFNYDNTIWNLPEDLASEANIQ